VTGHVGQAPLAASRILVEDGLITEVGGTGDVAEMVVEADGLDAAPGLIDSHVHPVMGEFSPVPRGIGWLTEYFHGGVTSAVSAGELTTPGLAGRELTPELCSAVAESAARLFAGLPLGTRIHAGTLLLVPGLRESDFRRIAQAGGRCVKFIYYPIGPDRKGEIETYRDWAGRHGLVLKLHVGGTSYRGESVAAGRAAGELVRPDIYCHLNGGPIPMADDDVEWVIRETQAAFEVIPGGNLRVAQQVIRWAQEQGAIKRLLFGTDTPGGSGITPRAMLQIVAYSVAMGGLEPSDALAAATGNVAAAHGLAAGFIEVGKPADIILLGAVAGSAASTGLGAIRRGDIPSVACVLRDGEVAVQRSLLTPPPQRPARFGAGRSVTPPAG
jgi:enamidase